MGRIGTLVLNIIMAANAAVLALLVMAACSSYVSPSKFPILSCLGLAYMLFFIANLVFLAFWLFVKPIRAIVPLAGIVFTWGAFRLSFPVNIDGQSKGKTLTFLTYNVMGMNKIKPRDGENQVLAYLARSGADIICLQEYILFDEPYYLKENEIFEALSMYPYHASVAFNHSNQVACFSKYPITGSRRINYESKNNGSVVFTLLVEGKEIIVINNHLESNKLTAEDKDAYTSLIQAPSTDAIRENLFSLVRKLADAADVRAGQVKAVAKEMEQYRSMPLIVCGDFNDGPLSYAHRILNKGMQDAFERRGRGMGVTYNQNKFYFRLDNILANDAWRIVKCKVDKSITASDHYPLIAEIELKEQ